MPAGSIPLPIKEDNPLVIANNLHRKSSKKTGKCMYMYVWYVCMHACVYVLFSAEHEAAAVSPHEFTPSSSAISTSPSSSTTTTTSANTGTTTISPPSNDKWLSQVEILTHAPPSRHLWEGPQFAFRSYQSLPTSSTGVANSVSGADLIKTPSPPNTIIYSGSLNSSVSSNVIAQQVMAASSSMEREGREEQSAVLFPCAESPLLDILSETAEVKGLGANSSPLAVPGCVGKRDRLMEPGQKVNDAGECTQGCWGNFRGGGGGQCFEK